MLDGRYLIMMCDMRGTSCMRSMLKLGESGGMPPKKIRCQEIEFGDISELDNIAILAY